MLNMSAKKLSNVCTRYNCLLILRLVAMKIKTLHFSKLMRRKALEYVKKDLNEETDVADKFDSVQEDN